MSITFNQLQINVITIWSNRKKFVWNSEGEGTKKDVAMRQNLESKLNFNHINKWYFFKQLYFPSRIVPKQPVVIWSIINKQIFLNWPEGSNQWLFYEFISDDKKYRQYSKIKSIYFSVTQDTFFENDLLEDLDGTELPAVDGNDYQGQLYTQRGATSKA